MTIVRPELPADHEVVRQVHDLAIAGPTEAALAFMVAGLRAGALSEGGGEVNHAPEFSEA